MVIVSTSETRAERGEAICRSPIHRHKPQTTNHKQSKHLTHLPKPWENCYQLLQIVTNPAKIPTKRATNSFNLRPAQAQTCCGTINGRRYCRVSNAFACSAPSPVKHSRFASSVSVRPSWYCVSSSRTPTALRFS